MSDPNETTKRRMQTIGDSIKNQIPDGWCFFAFVVPPGEDNRANYVSNLNRQNAIAVMKEFLIKCGSAEEWMKHIK